MKTKISRFPALGLALVAMLTILNAPLSAAPLGTAFTYQGRLTDGTGPASGGYDLRFTVFDALTNGTFKAMVTNASVAVTNGLFTTPVDFGQAPANFAAMWLEIGVRTNGSAGDFTAVSPRQALLPTPYAFYALNSSNAVSAATASNVTPGSINSASIQAGSITVTNVNTASLAGAFWSLGGNSGTTPGVSFLGTADNQPLELRVNGLRAFRLEPNAGGANVVGGSPANSVSDSIAAVIGGGISNQVVANYSTVGGGVRNVAGGMSGWFATVGGGDRNNAGGDRSIIGGGACNTNSDYVSVIGGGCFNLVNFGAQDATIAGGIANTVSSSCDTIGGGGWNMIGASAFGSSIGGGELNSIQASSIATIAGGSSNSIASGANGACIGGGVANTNQASLSMIGGGEGNSIQTNADHSFLGGGYSNSIQTNADHSFLGSGDYNSIQAYADRSFLGGGYDNFIEANADHSFLGGGENNFIQPSASHSFLGGGSGNFIQTNAALSFLGGGEQNIVSGTFGVVPGGGQNAAVGDYSFAAGRRAKANYQGDFVWADSMNYDFDSMGTNQFLIRASGGVGINKNNPSTALDVNGTVTATTLVGGSVGLGTATPAFSLDATASQAVGRFTTTNNIYGSVLVLDNATPGLNYHGAVNFNDGAGQIAYLNGDAMTFTTLNGERMRILNNGNIGMGNSNPTNKLMVVNARCDGSSWINASDRNLKQDFFPVNPQNVLIKVAALPVQTWSYKAQPGEKHLGPVAQDFRAAFGLGADDVSIATVDEGGVALAAIQGLNQKLENEAKAKDAEIQELKQSVAELKAMVEKLAGVRSRLATTTP